MYFQYIFVLRIAIFGHGTTEYFMWKCYDYNSDLPDANGELAIAMPSGST